MGMDFTAFMAHRYADREFGWESEGYYIDDFGDYKI